MAYQTPPFFFFIINESRHSVVLSEESDCLTELELKNSLYYVDFLPLQLPVRRDQAVKIMQDINVM